MTSTTALPQTTVITAPAPGIIGQVRRLLLQPRQFFRHFPTDNQQWLLVALIILSLTALTAVLLAAPDASNSVGVPVPPEGIPFEGEFPPDFGMPGDGGVPTSNASTTDIWTTALSAAGTMIIQWGVIAMLLGEISLFNRRLPQIGTNFQLAVWASVPLALLAIVQMMYLSNGNTIENPGFSGFLTKHEGYLALSLPLQSVIYAFASQFNLFWLWQLSLLYLGGRIVLRGKRGVVLMVVGLWVLLLTLSTGYQHYQQELAMPSTEPAVEMPVDFIEMTPEAEMTPDVTAEAESTPDAESTPEGMQP